MSQQLFEDMHNIVTKMRIKTHRLMLAKTEKEQGGFINQIIDLNEVLEEMISLRLGEKEI